MPPKVHILSPGWAGLLSCSIGSLQKPCSYPNPKSLRASQVLSPSLQLPLNTPLLLALSLLHEYEWNHTVSLGPNSYMWNKQVTQMLSCRGLSPGGSHKLAPHTLLEIPSPKWLAASLVTAGGRGVQTSGSDTGATTAGKGPDDLPPTLLGGFLPAPAASSSSS